MFEEITMRRAFTVAIFCAMIVAGPLLGQEAKKGGSVPITFVPPPLENATYSVGIYDVKSGKLARRLCEAAGQNTFKIGLNGLITSWDGKDDDGKPLPPGRYAARGYAAGAMEVEGLEVLANDWAADNDHLRIARIDAICLVPDDGGVAIAGRTPWGVLQVARYGKDKVAFLWQSQQVMVTPKPPAFTLRLPQGGKFLRAASTVGDGSFRLTDGEANFPATADGSLVPVPAGAGRDGTTWKIAEGVVVQYAPSGEALRSLAPVDGEPVPVSIATSPESDRIYLLEETKGWQRVRGLTPVESREENGKRVSTWQTHFERNIRVPDPASGLEDPANAHGPGSPVELTLDESPLAPGKRPRGKFAATFDAKGSYLSTADGLRLRQISERGHLRAVRLTKDKDGLQLYESDGAAWDQYGIRGAGKVIAFDAGEFEIDATGEKPNAEKAPEPDL